jgi:hypothetical protein
MTEPQSTDTPGVAWARLVHYAILILLIGGGIAYWYFKPPSLNPMADPGAAQALALVQTHPAQGAPTVLQAINTEVGDLIQRGRRVRTVDWLVQHQKGDPNGRIYVVRYEVREEGSTGWIEREYLWQVDIVRKRVFPVSLPAQFIMPIQPESPP